MEEFAKNVRRYRSRAKLTQQELAELTGVSYPRISEWENGRTNPRLSTIELIAEALEITPDLLLKKS